MGERQPTRPVRPRSIRALLFILLLSVLIPVLLVQAGVYYREFHLKRMDEYRSNLEVARAVAAAFDSYIEDARRDELAIGRALVLLSPFSIEQANTYLTRAAEGYPSIRSLSWTDPRGRIIASSSAAMIGRDLSGVPLVRKIIRGDDWGLTNMVRSQAPEERALSLASGIRDSHGSLRGVMVEVIDPARLHSRINIERTGGGAFAIIDSSGWLVFRHPEWNLPFDLWDWANFYPGVREALKGRELTGVAFDRYEKKERIYALVPIRPIGWAARASRPEAEAIGPLRRDLLRDVGILAAVSLFAFLIATVGARRISMSLQRLRGHALAMGRGELHRRMVVSGPSELLDFAHTFNRMAGELQGREHEHERLLEVERERAKDAALLQTIQETSSTCLAYLDGDLRFVRVNSAYCKAIGRPAEELTGRTHFEIWRNGTIVEILQRASESGQAATFHEMPRQDIAYARGEVTYWDLTVAPVKDESGVVQGLVLSAADVTDRVRAREQLLAAERTRAQLAETVAAEINHRMKNNLALLSGMLDMQLSAQPRGSAAAGALQQAITRISSLSVVHEQLIEAQSGRVELTNVLRRIAEVVTGALSRQDVQVSVEGDPVYVPSKVGSAISVVANELITNAVKYGAPASDGTLQMGVNLSLQQGRLYLSIWNSGNPVPADFDLAKQSGMGLRLARTVAEGQFRGSLTLRPHNGGTLSEVVIHASALDIDSA